jgi:hypothetical protein
MNKAYLCGIVVGVVVVVVGVWILGWYPVAMVQRTPVLAYEYRTNLSMASSYYEGVGWLTEDNQIPQDELEMILKETVVTGLIDEVIVTRYLSDQLGKGVYNDRLEERVAELAQDGEFMAQLSSIMDASDKDVRTYFLRTKVRYEMLEEIIEEDVLTWLDQQRPDAHIQVYVPELVWDGSQVVARDR